MAVHGTKFLCKTICAATLTLRNRRCCISKFVMSQFRLCTTLSTPVPDGADKIYPAHISNIVAQISKLTLLEVADLNDLLKRTLKIPDAPMMAFSGSMPSASSKAEEEEEVEPVAVKVNFTVKIVKFDDTKKVALIKQVKSLMEGMNLVQAKKFVESLPQIVRADIPKDEAEKLQESLVAAGAECVIE